MNFSIRKAVATDAEAIAQILQELGWHDWVNSMPCDQVITQIESSILKNHADESHSVYVAMDENDVVGYVTVHWLPCLFIEKLRGYVSDLFVRENSRGKGAGAALLATVKSEAVERGSASLSTLTRKGRESYKQGFYRKQGWIERETLVGFICELPPTGEAS